MLNAGLGNAESYDSKKEPRGVLRVTSANRITGTNCKAGASRKGNCQYNKHQRAFHGDLPVIRLR